jgi:ClpP class serine protease
MVQASEQIAEQTTLNNERQPRRNPAIEAVLANGQLAIEYGFGMQCLNQYLTDLSLLAHGATYKDLGIEQRRRESDPYLLQLQGAGKYTLVRDRGLIYNTSITPVNSFAVIPIKGFMQTEGSGGSNAVRGMRSVADDLRAAYQNPNISGVLLDINSGGGEVMAMEVLLDALSVRNKPVLSHVIFAASAAYGTAAGTDEVIAISEAARTGSVGAVISINKMALQEYTDVYLDVYGKNAPNKNKEFRAMQNGDFGPLQSVVDEATDMFQSKVKALRPLRGNEAKINDTVSGEVFTGPEARRRGLIDGIGGMEYAIKRLEAWTKNPRYRT